MRFELPYAAPAQRIGLLGGSFDPAHAGHVHITKAALRRFGLDQVWWLVSPGNPLKARGPQPLAKRIGRARQVMVHPKVQITDIEARLGTVYTARTLAALQGLYPRIAFTWLMGADNLAQFHLWEEWPQIMATTRVGILARPGERIAARTSPAAKVFRRAQIKGRDSQSLSGADAPAWCFVNIPMSDESSTAIRAQGGWG